MKCCCFACVGGILKPICVCVYFRSRGKSCIHTHTHKEGETCCKLWSAGEKENFINFKHSSSCSARLGPKCSILNTAVIDLRPWSSVKCVVPLTGNLRLGPAAGTAQRWTRTQKLPPYEVLQICVIFPQCWWGSLRGRGSCHILNPAQWSVTCAVLVAPRNGLILYFGQWSSLGRTAPETRNHKKSAVETRCGKTFAGVKELTQNFLPLHYLSGENR